jgi:DNA-binding NarL/FixJ family response regulator
MVQSTLVEDDATVEARPPRELDKGSRRQKLRILLIDRRTLRRESVARLLESVARDFNVVSVCSAQEVLDEMSVLAHLIVINVGVDLLSESWISNELRMIRSQMAEVPLVMLCDSDDFGQVIEGLALGLRGIIPTTTSPAVAVEAIRLINAGGTFIPASALKWYGDDHAAAAAAATAKRAGPYAGQFSCDGQAQPLQRLTARQKEVLQLLCNGKPNKVIACELKMREGTVKVHVREIMKKLKAANRTEVAIQANQLWGADGKG